MDLASASPTVAWWENDGAAGGWARHVVDGTLDQRWSIDSQDLDGDGDLDLLGANYFEGYLTWWENDGAPADGLWTAQVIEDAFTMADAVRAADLDGDGDLDVLGAAFFLGGLVVWPNRGGQFVLATTDFAPATLVNGDLAAIFDIEMTHRGRTGDAQEELITLELLFEEAPDTTLTAAQVDALMDGIHVFRDDDDGVFDIDADTLVATAGGMSVSEGLLTISLADGDSNVQVDHGEAVTFFVVVEAASDGSLQSPNAFMITHLTDVDLHSSVSEAEDRDYDLGLSLEWGADSTSMPVVVLGANGDACTDVIGTHCVSGFCVDGVCCDEPCYDGDPDDCAACSIAAGAEADGTCSILVDVECRGAADDCDVVEICDGSGPECPADEVLSVGTECREAAGVCDGVETCDGVGIACPDDELLPEGTVCRASAGDCDVAEMCDGVGAACPDDDPAAMNGESCDDDIDETINDECVDGECVGTDRDGDEDGDDEASCDCRVSGGAIGSLQRFIAVLSI